MKLLPSVRRWVGASLVLLVLALALGNLVLMAGAFFLLFVVLLAVLVGPPSNISINRHVSRTVCWVGDKVEVERRVQVGRGVGLIFVHDRLPDEMQVEEGNNLGAVWRWPWHPSNADYDFSYQMVCPKRGKFVLDETDWETEDPLGFRSRASGVEGGTLELSVVPRVQGVSRIKEIRSQAAVPYPEGDYSHIGVATTDFTEIRPYSIGDPLRSVNWKASARYSGSDSPLLVNKYEPEGRKSVWLFLDGASYMEIGTSLSNPMEQAVEAASGLAQFYLSRGYTLGAYIYNNPQGLLFPDVGQKQFHRLNQLLLTLKPGDSSEGLVGGVEWCKSSLFRLKPHVFVVTRLDVHTSESDSLRQLVQGVHQLVSMGARSRRPNPVGVVGVSAYGYLPSDDLLDSQARDLMRWETQPLVELIRRAGASVLEWNPWQENFSLVLMRHLHSHRAIR